MAAGSCSVWACGCICVCVCVRKCVCVCVCVCVCKCVYKVCVHTHVMTKQLECSEGSTFQAFGKHTHMIISTRTQGVEFTHVQIQPSFPMFIA